MAIQLKTSGAEHPDAGNSYFNLGRVYGSQGDYSKAIEHHTKSLSIRLKALGAEHPDVADSYNNLGLEYNTQGNYSKALEYYEKCLPIYLKTFGAEHPKTKLSQELLDSLRDEIKKYF